MLALALAALMLTDTLCACSETAESTLRAKIAQDPQSAHMMDIIDHIHIDAGIIYTEALSGFQDKFRQIIGSGKNTVTSQYRSVTRSAKKALEKMAQKLDTIISEEE